MSNIEAVFAATSNEELADNYDKWAAAYEVDLGDIAGPREAVEQIVKYVPPSARILDAGCGTGVIGQLLGEQGFSRVEGLDISAGMIQEAEKKRCYTAFHQQILGDQLSFENDSFDAVVIVGVFVRAHARSNSFAELIRITKPGGHIIFTLRPEFYANTDFKTTMDALETAGRWTLVEVTEPFHGRSKMKPDVNLQVWIYSVNESY